MLHYTASIWVVSYITQSVQYYENKVKMFLAESDSLDQNYIDDPYLE